MNIFRGFENAGAIPNPVVTIGSYDGVHCGHREILARLSDEARRVHGESVVITFEPHPRMVLDNKDSVQLITTLPEKAVLLEKAGVDNIIVVDFTGEFSRLSYLEFIEKYLVGKLHVHTLLVGYNHHFGHNKEGNIANLNDMSQRLGFKIYEMPKQTVEGEKVSSTVVRTLIHRGNMRDAAKYLGHSYFIMGEPVIMCEPGECNRSATLRGIPEYKLLPRTGVYPVDVEYDGQSVPAIAHINDGREVRISASGGVIPSGPVTVKFV